MVRIIVWQLYWFLVVVLLTVAYWRTAPDLAIEQVNEFILDFYPTILGIGTVVLISFLALLTTVVSIEYSERREASNRRVQAELKIAEFRQIWINELRDDITKYSKVLFQHGSKSTFGDAELDEVYTLMTRINLKLNHRENLANELWEKINAAFELACSYQTGDSEAERAKIMEVSQNAMTSAARQFLKNEWDRLKEDLEKAQTLRSD